MTEFRTKGKGKKRKVYPIKSKGQRVTDFPSDFGPITSGWGSIPDPYIRYAGSECAFKQEFDNVDEAQAMIDYWKGRGRLATCTHSGDSHYLYVETDRDYALRTGMCPECKTKTIRWEKRQNPQSYGDSHLISECKCSKCGFIADRDMNM